MLSLVVALAACGGSPATPSGVPPSGVPATGPAGSSEPNAPASNTPTDTGCAPLEELPARSPAPDETPSPIRFQSTYARIAAAFNTRVPQAFAVLADPASTLEARVAAVRELAAAEHCYGDRLAALELPPQVGSIRERLGGLSGQIADGLDAAAASVDAATLAASVGALLPTYDAAAQGADDLVAALIDACRCQTWMPPESWAGIAPGPPTEPPGELWVSDLVSWSVEWQGQGGGASYEYSTGVQNPWDEFALDVVAHIWFTPETSPFGAARAIALDGVAPASYATIEEHASGPPIQDGFTQIIGSVASVGSWHSVPARTVPGR